MKSTLEMSREELIIRIMDLESQVEENIALKKNISDRRWVRDGDRMGGSWGERGYEYDEWGALK